MLVSPDGRWLFSAYGGSSDVNMIRLIRASDGEELWCNEYEDGDQKIVTLELSRDGAAFYIGLDSGVVAAFQCKDGQRLWSYEVGETVPSDWHFNASSDGGKLVFWAADGSLHCLSAQTGERLWQSPTSLEAPASWQLQSSRDGARVYYTTQGGSVVAVSGVTGDLLWTAPSLFSPSSSSTAGQSDNAAAAQAAEAAGHNLSSYSSAPCASATRFESWIAALAPDGSCLYFVDGSGNAVRCLAAGSGVERWHYSDALQTHIISGFSVSPDGASVVALYNDGSLRALDASGGKLRWSLPPGSAGESKSGTGDSETSTRYRIVIDHHGSRVLRLSSDGDLKCFSLANASLDWSCRLGPVSKLDTLQTCPNGLWVMLETADEHVHSFNLEHGISQWSLDPRTTTSSPAGQEEVAQRRLSPSALIRKKRFAVLAVLAFVLYLRRNGYLRRTGAGEEADQDLLSAALTDLLGAKQAQALLGREPPPEVEPGEQDSMTKEYDRDNAEE